MTLRSLDFESSTSASSVTPALIDDSLKSSMLIRYALDLSPARLPALPRRQAGGRQVCQFRHLGMD